jgi:cellulose biosynthesis protein BcsQ
MTDTSSKAIFIGNIKGGVGKSLLTAYLTDYLRRRFKGKSVMLVDTDPQGTAFEMLEPTSPKGSVRSLPVGDRYDGVNMSTLDGVLRRLLGKNDTITMVDTGAGKVGNLWRIIALSQALIVPTSMSWADLRPTIEFIKDIDERKLDQGISTPHVIVVPNRVSPNQRDFSAIAEALTDVNAVLAPPISDLVVARGKASTFNGLSDVQGTRFHGEISRLGAFIVDYVISGELDRIYGVES